VSAGVKGLNGHILISHTHWDHIQGIPFFAPLFTPGSQWDIYGPKGLDQSLRETLSGQMQYTYFPITLDQFEATIRYHDLVEGTFDIDGLKVTTHYLNHPALTLGYRLEADGATVVYCSDHEPHSRDLAEGKGEIAGQDLRYAEFISGADLLIHDAQYTAEEYSTKVGWGHSSVEYAIRLGQHAKAKKLILTHHDPLRDDDAIDRMLGRIRTQLQATSSPMQVFAAAERETIEIEPSRSNFSERFVENFSATASVEPALAERSVLLGISDPSTAVVLSEAVRAEGIRPQFFSRIEEAQTIINEDRPSLVILEHDKARIDGMTACREIRQIANHELPVVMIAAQQDAQAGAAAGVTDWLISPFSDSYARTKIRAWVLRTECRWIRATIPDDEERRIAALHELRILDTEPEDRFDRVTRLAAALFDVPMVLISLVDENRQWFKSCLGLDSKETPRDAAFCAHVIHSREPMIVSDTFRDHRFADNPLVINEPRIRFYAGYPLILDDGSCLGTLCLLDTRPRDLKSPDLARLRDLAQITLREMVGS
jgi:phosphoribosyl 1,2-cyclic phosphodiesterase/DNA-binding response OmpR family regulator